MQTSEDYRGSRIDVFVSKLASGRASFTVYIDGKMLNVEIDGPDETKAMELGINEARQAIDNRVPSADVTPAASRRDR